MLASGQVLVGPVAYRLARRPGDQVLEV